VEYIICVPDPLPTATIFEEDILIPYPTPPEKAVDTAVQFIPSVE
jgi:hypothetical protein